MRVINIADHRDRHARVSIVNKLKPAITHLRDRDDQRVISCRVIKSTLATDFKILNDQSLPEELSQRLIDGDPELDIEIVGKRIWGTKRLFLTVNDEPAKGVQTAELYFNREGELTDERPLKVVEANINTDLPLIWSGKLLPKSTCYKQFVFVHALQLRHVDELSFDFLYSMAKELEEKNSMLFVGAGQKASDPLILTRNGQQFQAFLEGKTEGKRYQLILRLSNLELKPMPMSE